MTDLAHEHEAQNRMVEAAGLLRWAATELRAAGRESLAGELDDESDRIRDLMTRLSWDVELPPEEV